MVQRDTHNHICRECGRPSHRGMPANQGRRKRFRRLVRPGVKAKTSSVTVQASSLDSKTTAYNA